MPTEEIDEYGSGGATSEVRVVRSQETPQGTPRVDSGNAEEEKAEKPLPPSRIPPDPDKVLIPTRGWPARRYALHRWLGRPGNVPPPGTEEYLDLEIAYLEERLTSASYMVLAELQSLRCATENVSGGGSKSTGAMYIGSTMIDVARIVSYVLPATAHTTTSSLTMNAWPKGREEAFDTLTVSEFYAQLERLDSFTAVDSLVGKNNVGLRVIKEDPKFSVKDAHRRFGKEKFSAVAEALAGNAGFTIFDTGNDDVEPTSVVLEAARRSDVLVFSATADHPKSLEKLAPTISIYQTDDEYDRVSRRTLRSREEPVGFTNQQKIKHSIAAISKVRDDQDPDDFRQYLPNDFTGTFLTIPFDPYIASNVVCDIKAIEKATYAAYLRLDLSIVESAAKMYNIPLPEPDARFTVAA